MTRGEEIALNVIVFVSFTLTGVGFTAILLAFFEAL